MADAVRFGVSMSKKLLVDFDRLIAEKGYKNRSEAIRKLIREKLVQKEWESSKEEIVATITMVYSHEVRELTERLTEMQHKYYKQIISAMHIHLDEHNCLEMLAIRGRADEVKKIADRLLSTKGIKHGQLTTTSTGKRLV
uniref:Putative nickel-responsive regulator n=1 Tax=candidate division WOR-3 bacterium TaxID=2052148 RepID=A0A7V0Z4V4_UNCW3